MGVAAAIAGAVGTIGSAAISSSAASSAAAEQAQASQASAQIQEDIYNTTANNLAPFRSAGAGALTNLANLLPGGLTTAGGGASTAGAPAGGQTVSIPGVGDITLGGTGGASAATPTPGTQLATGQSQFLTDLEGNLPGSGTSLALAAVNSLVPGAANASPLLNSVQQFVPGATSTPSPLLSSINGFVPGAGPANPLLTSAESFVPGSGVAPDASLSALESFVPGAANQNPLLTNLDALLGVNGNGGTPDPAEMQTALAQTPGYQFALQQGLLATQNSYAAQGLGSSGNALAGAASYATGLASQTYDQQLNNYLNAYNSQFSNTYNAYTGQAGQALNTYNSGFTNNLNAYNTQFTNAYNTYGQAFNNALNTSNSQFTNSLNAYGQQTNLALNTATLGENAGAQTGYIGSQTGANVSNTLTSGAAASAAGIVGSANAASNALTGLANNYGAYSLLSNAQNNANTAANSPTYNALTQDMTTAFTNNAGVFGGS